MRTLKRKLDKGIFRDNQCSLGSFILKLKKSRQLKFAGSYGEAAENSAARRIGPLQLGSRDQIFPRKFLYYGL